MLFGRQLKWNECPHLYITAKVSPATHPQSNLFTLIPFSTKDLILNKNLAFSSKCKTYP